MKDLIVYFSLEGNTEYVVKKLQESLGAEALRLVPKKAYHDKGASKFIWGGKSAIMGEKPELENYEIHLYKYDRIIFGFPVWASTFTPPIRTFINDNREEISGKRFAAFACQTGAGAEKALEKLSKYLNETSFEQTAIFLDPKSKPSEATDQSIEAFANALKQE